MDIGGIDLTYNLPVGTNVLDLTLEAIQKHWPNMVFNVLEGDVKINGDEALIYRDQMALDFTETDDWDPEQHPNCFIHLLWSEHKNEDEVVGLSATLVVDSVRPIVKVLDEINRAYLRTWA